MDDIQELREAVNPVFNTAKACLQIDAKIGDEDSQQLLDVLGFGPFGDSKQSAGLPPEILAQVERMTPVFVMYTGTRFYGMNQLIASRPDCAVVDLPSGYTARGIKMAREGRTYLGIDLPAVIDVIGPATKDVIGDCPNVTYAAADATNYESLRAATEGLDKPLLITTEGLLMYFTQSEVEAVFSAIHRILEEHGGSWVIVDRTYTVYEGRLAAAILEHDERLMALHSHITSKGSGGLSDTKTFNNVFFTEETDEGVVDFIHRAGFAVKKVCMADYLPEKYDVEGVSVAAEAEYRDIFKEMYYWELTPEKTRKTQKQAAPDLPFAFNMTCSDGELAVGIQGRLDTITATDLLQGFRDVAEPVVSITLDVSDMSYISSAGLRVLLIMYKSILGKGTFRIDGVTDSVREIFEVTGFADLLLAD